MGMKGLLAAVLTFVLTGSSLAKDILITNDTGTQRKGHCLVEVNSEYGLNKKSASMPGYGISSPDLILRAGLHVGSFASDRGLQADISQPALQQP